MENRKPKYAGSLGLRIAGWILTGMGVVWLGVGLPFLTVLRDTPMEEGEAWVLGLVFTLMGAVMLCIGLPMLIVDARQRKLARRLMREGTCYEAEVVHAYYSSMQVNNRPGLILECRYTDSGGATHLVKSKPLWRVVMLPNRQANDFRVRVWVDPYDAKQYFVDVQDPTLASGVADYDDR